MTGYLRTGLQRHAQNCIGALGKLSRQPLASMLTIGVIGIALALPSALNVLVRNGQVVAGGLENVRDFSIYLKPGEEVEAATTLAAELESLALVEDVRVVPADQAMEEFSGAVGFADVIETLERNPLPHALVVRPVAEAPVHDLQELAGELSARTTVDLVKVDLEWLARLNALLDLVRRAIWLAAAMLVAAVIIIIGNTIRLDIQNRREEIEVSKLLGASNSFVRRPFLYTGLWYGLLGGCFALALLGFGLWLLSGPVERLVALYGGSFRPLGLDGATALAVVSGGLLGGLGGAWTAVARHLAAIQPKV